MHKALHIKVKKTFKLTFVNKSLVCIPVWIEQKKLLILGFGIFEKVHLRPKIWSFENEPPFQWISTDMMLTWVLFLELEQIKLLILGFGIF